MCGQNRLSPPACQPIQSASFVSTGERSSGSQRSGADFPAKNLGSEVSLKASLRTLDRQRESGAEDVTAHQPETGRPNLKTTTLLMLQTQADASCGPGYSNSRRAPATCQRRVSEDNHHEIDHSPTITASVKGPNVHGPFFCPAFIRQHSPLRPTANSRPVEC